ncbi:MAG: hypothetical protein JWO94_3549, partial [Verrucomicrobiaceae bacterium]|nr:hypothetical protein [Verrucomicrobiaceae bacterium]
MNILSTVTLPYGFGYLFDTMFTDLGTLRTDVYSTLSIFTYVLAFAGLLICAYRQQTGGDLGQMGNQLMWTAVVAMALQFLPDWVLDAEPVLGWKMISDMNIDMETITTNWIAEVAAYITEQFIVIVGELTAASALGVLSIVGGIVMTIYALIAMICVAIVAIMAVFVWAILLAAYIVEAVSVELGVATAPIFLGMFL